MCLRATTAHEAGILCGSRQHITGTPGRGGPCVHANWQPPEASGGSICWPLPGGLQRGQDVHHPGGPEAGDSLYGPPEGPHWGPVSPVGASSCGRPHKKLATPTFQPAHLLGPRPGGAHVEDHFILIFVIIIICASLLIVSEVNLCSYMEKSTKYSEQKCTSYFRE